MSNSEMEPGSEHPNSESRKAFAIPNPFKRKDVDYQKLYDQEKKGTRDLSNKLEEIYERIKNAAAKLGRQRLFNAISADPEQGRAQRAVKALIAEFEQSLKDLRVLNGLFQDGKRKIGDLEYKVEMEKEQRVINESRMEDDKHQLRIGFEKQISRAQTERKNEKELMDGLILQMKRDFDREREQLIDGHKISKAQILKAHEEFSSKLTSDFERKRSRLQSDHAQEVIALREDIKALNEAIVAREHVKSLSDQDIKSLFSTLEGLIDQIARLGWKYNRTEWKDELLDRAKNPRKLRKNILQESLWLVLYENIFCSPFRTFGEEGRSLETQWIFAFGGPRQPQEGPYSWPTPPSLSTEQWRYEAIKKCREALAQPASEYDPRHKLKTGFGNSLDTVQKEMSEMIRKVSDIDDVTAQNLEKIARKAAEIWLEFGTQRCRIQVDVSGANPDLPASERARKTQEGSQEFVVVPRLWRVGNSKGQDFDKKKIIPGCNGTTEPVVYK